MKSKQQNMPFQALMWLGRAYLCFYDLILTDLVLGRLCTVNRNDGSVDKWRFTGQQECDQTSDFLGITQTFGRVVLYKLFGRRLPVIWVNLFE